MTQTQSYSRQAVFSVISSLIKQAMRMKAYSVLFFGSKVSKLTLQRMLLAPGLIILKSLKCFDYYYVIDSKEQLHKFFWVIFEVPSQRENFD